MRPPHGTGILPRGTAAARCQPHKWRTAGDAALPGRKSAITTPVGTADQGAKPAWLATGRASLLAERGYRQHPAAIPSVAQAALRRRIPAMPRSAKPITLSVAGSGSATPRMSMLPLAA
ncbi:MAG: hypothetical protein AW07_02022 [Candidatus Accumulibacter sp. SK-11]|nr:MAG: hypothetical protein AW07_02022 [Candidatus Accumulibacter sp. SK-11]